MPDARPRSTRRLTAAVLAVAVAVLVALVAYEVRSEPQVERTEPTADALVRDDTHVLDDPADSRATLVEFLDFECEACGAFYPLVEDIRERYEGELTFAFRYFPLDGHLNSRAAAHAVEAAARQDEVEAMYTRMFETQAEWGDQQVDHAATFRGFAEELGLDLEQFDRDVADPEVAARVDADFQEGTSLGVSGTPTFYLDGERIEPQSVEEFYALLDEAVGR